MKTLIILIVGFMIPYSSYSQANVSEESETQAENLRGKITVFSAPELLEVSKQWAEEFVGLNPKLNIRVSAPDIENENDILPRGTDIRITYSGNQSFEQENIAPIILGREIIVAVLSAKNPFLEELSKSGINQSQLGLLFDDNNGTSWGSLLGSEANNKVSVRVLDDNSVLAALADFIGSEKAGETIDLFREESVTNMIADDPYALGFCKMADILDESGRQFKGDIVLLPIDRNGNGLIDSHENIFSNYEAFTRGVWIGKYPKELYRNIYSLSEKNQVNEPVIAFLEWIVTTGQKNLVAMGYDDIVYNEKRANLSALFISEIETSTSGDLYAGQKFLALLIGLILVTGIIVSFVARIVVYRKSGVRVPDLASIPVFDLNSVLVRNGLHFDKSHMWAFMNEDGNVRIGIDDFLQHVTGPITRIKMKLPGERVKKGEKVLTIIQRGKRLNIYSPVSGIIREKNDALGDDANLINSSPYNEGWVYQIEPTNWIHEIPALLMGQNYKNWLKEEFHRLKDFLTSSLSVKFHEKTGIVLQEGGQLKDGILDECGPEIWEEFQANFIDNKE